MNSIAKVQNIMEYEHSPQIFTRRRTLFPASSSDSEDSDLGPMSPLSYDSLHDLDEKYLSSTSNENNDLSEKISTIGDYHILGVVENNVEIYTPDNAKACAHSETMSPLLLSPDGSKAKIVSDSALDDSKYTVSPSSTLKTPHDSSTFKPKLPKLVRKSILDSADTSNKRKLSPTLHGQSKQIKLDPSSKVRTTLFPDLDMSLPTNKFYSSTEDVMEEIRNRKKVLAKPSVSHGSRRKVTVSKKRDGAINAGVRHKIRRPKKKRNLKYPRITTMNESEQLAINTYLEDLKQLKSNTNETSTILIENKENFVPEEQPVKQIIMPPKLNKIEMNSVHNEIASKKRPVSPTHEEPNPNKKFFKSSRTTKTVYKNINITVNKNIKVQVDHGKMALLDKSKPKTSMNLDPSDFTIKEDNELPKTNIDDILNSLSEDIDTENHNKIILQAHNSVVASENSILLHQEPSGNMNLILSPISQMCDFTSGLALNSPKRSKNLSTILDKMSNSNSTNDFENAEEKKPFPIFSHPNSGITPLKQNKLVTIANKKFKKISEDQMLLDAGQKKFGVTQCTECQFVYHIGDPGDETMHINYHTAAPILRFSGWKNERVVADFNTKGRVIKVLPSDSKLWWKRVTDLMLLINRDLGCFEMEFKLDNCQVFLYIKSRTIVGCVVAIAKSEGHRMLTSKANEPDVCSEEKLPIKCGVSRIWVSYNYRQQGIGSALMDALKNNFLYGSILTNSEIAISAPTEMGKEFAKKYFKSPNYLVYFV